jgi:hypothetical protein
MEEAVEQGQHVMSPVSRSIGCGSLKVVMIARLGLVLHSMAFIECIDISERDTTVNVYSLSFKN